MKNTYLFIANKLIKGGKKRFSRPIYILSIVAVSISIATMLISLAVVKGYQSVIGEKVSGFGSHIQVLNFDLNNSYEASPIRIDQNTIDEITQIPNINHVQKFSLKAGILKFKDQIEGVVMKGVDGEYDWSFMDKYIVNGRTLDIKIDKNDTEILISESIAKKLNIGLDDKIQVYFIQDPPRVRVFQTVGIYNTGLGNFDDKYLFVNINHINRLNNWDSDQFSGLEINIEKFEKLDASAYEVNQIIPYDLHAQTIKELNPEIFDWINLFDVNVVVLITIISIISIITLITTLLIFILEQTSTIGLLKSLGSNNNLIKKVFLTINLKIFLWGMLWGNIATISIATLQNRFKLLKLDAENYYIDHVPIELSAIHFLSINTISIILISLIMLVPIHIVTGRISAVKAIRYK